MEERLVGRALQLAAHAAGRWQGCTDILVGADSQAPRFVCTLPGEFAGWGTVDGYSTSFHWSVTVYKSPLRLLHLPIYY